ncbi:MAG: hypothetical protein LBS54_06740 [Dysgonamonadaceae bacterium]|jgi:hypothetical protein|nr:hypothetical protein [Dysgonamonadaceae bacterium]
MEKKKFHIEDILKCDPFKIPKGYFETFTSELMSRLPERKVQPAKTVTLWEKLQPWIYMAAMFVGISLTIRLFTNPPSKNDSIYGYIIKSINIATDADIEDYYNCYEDGLAKICFDDTMSGLGN